MRSGEAESTVSSSSDVSPATLDLLGKYSDILVGMVKEKDGVTLFSKIVSLEV